MELLHRDEYEQQGLDGLAISRLAKLGDILLGARSNVTAIRDPRGIELFHFLDSLSLLDLEQVAEARSLVDVGAGAGFPSLAVAIALSDTLVTAVESVRKKCTFIEQAVAHLGLTNVTVVCVRAEDAGRSALRDSFDVATARALSALSVVLEYTVPLVRPGGIVVAMKGAISDQERRAGEIAAGILGARVADVRRTYPFPEAENRWLCVVEKRVPTPRDYPRKVGIPGKRPLGGLESEDDDI